MIYPISTFTIKTDSLIKYLNNEKKGKDGADCWLKHYDELPEYYITEDEADINYTSGYRKEARIVYSNDGLIFVTYDHYKTFVEIV